MTTDHPENESMLDRITRRRAIKGLAAGAGIAATVPAIDVLGASLPYLQYDKDDDDDDRNTGGDDDDDDDHDTGGDDDDLSRSDITLPESVTVVYIEDDDDDGFSPQLLEIDAGQEVTFANLDDKQHTATGSDWDTGAIDTGATVTIPFDKAGTYSYACQFHPHMTGTINVRGGEESGGATPAASPVASPVAGGESTVTIVGFAFAPPEIDVAAGATVTWTNQDQVPHTATAEDGSFDSGTIAASAEASQTFDTPGTYAYVCAFHSNMKGTVVVK